MFSVGDVVMNRDTEAYGQVWCITKVNASHPLIIGCKGYELTYIFSVGEDLRPFKKIEIFTKKWVEENYEIVE